MNKIKCIIWERKFELPVEYDIFPGEEILEDQIKAINMFKNNIPESLKITAKIEKYCRENNPKDMPLKLDNIFKYVIPVSIYVKRVKNKKIVALLCNYRFDEENGIAMIFENNKLSEIGKQDIIL